MGAVSMMTGSSPASTAVCTRASGVRPSSRALSEVVISSAAAPSLICEALPAWMTPSSLNAGLSPASFSGRGAAAQALVGGRAWPSGSSTGAIWPASRPASVAAASLACEARENSSSWPRGQAPLLGDHLGADALVEGDAVALRAPCGPPGTAELAGPWRVAPIGTALIDSTPPATATSYWPESSPAAAKCTACWDEPHWRSTVVPGTDSGQPAASTAIRPRRPRCRGGS